MEEGEIEQFEEIGSSRGDARVLSLSLCVGRGRRRTSDGPPTVPDPIFFVRLSVYPLGSNSSRAWGIPRRPDVLINNAYNV